MLDPVIDFLKAVFAFIFSIPARGKDAVLGFFKLPPKTGEDGTPRRWRITRWLLKMAVAWTVLLWMGPLVWHATWVRGHDLHYPQNVISQTGMKRANQSTNVEDGTQDTLTGGRSQLVEMEIALIRFLVDENQWMESLPQYKFGFFTYPWAKTPFLDNKAAFQFGVLSAVRRVSVELADTIGRLRSTSEMDRDLQNARGNLQYDSETWWFNPFDDARPFGPVQPSPSVYRKAVTLLDSYNRRVESGNAVFDARADNLRSLMDRAANDLGSVADSLSKRSTAKRYNPTTHQFEQGEGNNRGWFDMEADNAFMQASGQVYAYHGFIQAARVDFATVIRNRGLTDVWNRLEQNLAEAADLDPWIISNGTRDGLIMPDHLAVMAEAVLRSRAVMQEISDILDR